MDSRALRPRREMATAAIALFAAGGAIAILSVLLPHTRELEVQSVYYPAIAALATALTLVLVRKWATYGMFHVLIAGSSVLLSWGTYLGGAKTANFSYALFFVWAGLYAFYYFGRKAATAQVLFGSATYAAAFILGSEGSAWVGHWLVTTITVGVSGLFVGWVVDQNRALAAAERERAEQMERMAEETSASWAQLGLAMADYSAFASAVARGDLTARVASNGSEELTALSDDLNQMVLALSSMSDQVGTGARDLSSAAAQMLATASEQTAGVTQQSAAILQTSTTVDELKASSEQTAQRAQEVSARAQKSVRASDEGAAAIDEILEKMDAIQVRVEAIAANILGLSEQTQQVAELTAAVDDIAEQSNLLALNATIEAARAGEQGKGFAVVAGEVRALAEQSKLATAQVRTILSEIQKATNATAMATEQGVKSVLAGSSLARRAGDSMQNLADVIRETAGAVDQIASAAQQQNLAVEQVADAMSEINEAATHFVSGVQESKTSAESVASLAQRLRSMTEHYRV